MKNFLVESSFISETLLLLAFGSNELAFNHNHILEISASENLPHETGWCLPSGTATNENRDQCINPDSFATFLGLLESVPLHGFGANNGTDEIPFPNSRYLFFFFSFGIDQFFSFQDSSAFFFSFGIDQFFPSFVSSLMTGILVHDLK